MQHIYDLLVQIFSWLTRKRWDSPMFRRPKTRLIEIVAAQNYPGMQLAFVDEADLRDVQILALELYSADDITISPQGNALPSYAFLQSCYVSLYTNNPDLTTIDKESGTVVSTDEGVYINLLPAIQLMSMRSGSTTKKYAPNIFQLNSQAIQFNNKSAFVFTQALGNTTGPISFLINVTYQGRSKG